jgi:hypothetical protein
MKRVRWVLQVVAEHVVSYDQLYLCINYAGRPSTFGLIELAIVGLLEEHRAKKKGDWL